ncbi:MAG: UDP-N-acetylglucosamine 1-carboxyvinyltransferase [Bacteroidetes bacterium QS_7_67_15]|nr:MAG: UDP-N-acetylglucosamine 1-carboxyvinyltransferase [Bacteroidetes bacterium QS_7_67_15]
MNKLVVEGRHPLSGSIPISGSKNTALPLMAASVLGDGTMTIKNVPNLRDVTTFAHVLRVAGARVQFDPAAHQLTIDAANITYPEAPYELVRKMRASFYMLGALIGRRGHARVSMPGGCSWGPRPVDLHLEGMKAFGAEIDLEQGYVVARAPGGRLSGGSFEMTPSSVGATINLLLAAVTAEGGCRIENAAREPDVVVFGKALEKMGAKIEGLGTQTIEIEGTARLYPVEFINASDRIELGTFMIAAAIAGAPGEPIRLTNAEPEYLGEAFVDAFRQTGAHVEIGDDYVEVAAPETLQPVDITTDVYPGFPTDLQAQWTVLLTQADGRGRITDTIYSDRFKHIAELKRMNAYAMVQDDTATVRGGRSLKGAQVMSTDLRASVSLVLAGLVAEGETHVLRVYHLDRGYEDLEGKLTDAGARIHRETYEEELSEPEELQEA